MNKTKEKFRATKVWKDWRKHLKETRKVDALTNKPLYKGFQVHHLDMREENYQILTEERFVTLNTMSHDCIHFLFRYYEKDPEIIKRLEDILIRMKEMNQ